MDWNCALTEDRLNDILDGTLAADQMAAFAGHAASCERCRALIARVASVVAQMRQLPLVDEPPFLASRIIAATRRPSATERRAKGRFAWLYGIWPTRIAMGLVTVAASFLIVFHAVSGAPRKIGVNPAYLYHRANRHAHLAYARGVKFVNDLRVVYVIQSRLSSGPQPVSEPTPTPLTEPGSAPGQRSPDSDSRPNSEPAPYTNRHGVQRTSELAVLILTDGLWNPSDQTARSLP